jgi:hypothetical protein
VFGLKRRRWLAELELPVEERETLDSCLRQIAFLDSEIAEVDRLIARAALGSAQVKRLMTVPGVNMIVAATLLAAIGDIDRFRSPRKLVGYLGLDPRVRQSGAGPATHGHIAKQGSRPARHGLVEACWSAVRQPGPLRAFYDRVRARRGRRRRGRAQARVPVLVPAHPRTGLRLCPAVADAQDAASARVHRRRATPPGSDRDLGRPRGDARGRARARPAGRDRLRAHDPRLAGGRAAEDGRERNTGARIR